MRWAAGLLLIAAALLKAEELADNPTIASIEWLGNYSLPTQIALELGVGLLLLSGLYWRYLRWFAVTLFAGFAGYSFYKAINGATSCGCFGPIEVHPWWTFTLDSVVVGGLLAAVWRERQAGGSIAKRSERWLLRDFSSRRQAIAVVLGVVLMSGALLLRYASHRTAVADSVKPSSGDLVILDPETWVGQKLPIANSIDMDLANGDWMVLLHRHDCPVCLEKVPQYEQRANAGERIALIEVPPYGEMGARRQAGNHGQLKADHRWIIRTPVEIRLHDGLVTSINVYEH
jgi:hypothetical protein